MKPSIQIFLALFLLCSISAVHAQDLYMGSEIRPIRITTGITYQQFSDDDRRLSEVSFPFIAFLPFTRQIGLTLRTNPALISGETVTSVQGLSDAQAALSYYQEIGEGSMVVSFTSNLPSGKRELTQDEFATTVLLSQDFYGFYVPVLGQGLNLSPGITFAYPINEVLVAGAGFAYQLKGSFKPVENMAESFSPGDELLITGGVDYRLNPMWAISSNFTYTLYQADKLGEAEVYESGNQSLISLQGIGDLGGNRLRLFARYRSKAKSVLPVGDDVVTAPRTIPTQFQFLGTYNASIQDDLRATVILRTRVFGKTDLFSHKTLVDLGASPQYIISENVTGVLRFIYTFGSFPGVEIGGGMVFNL